MPTGFTRGGVDFDDIFDPYVEGSKPAATGLTYGGSDLVNRYAPISYGTKAANVGFTAGGSDVSNLWAAKGTAVYAKPLLSGFGDEYLMSSGQDHDSTCSITLTLKTDGTWEVTKTGIGSIGGVPLTGTWYAPAGAGVGSGCEVRFDVNGVVGAWQALSADRSVSASATATYPAAPYVEQSLSVVVNVRRTNGTGLVSETVVLTATAEAFAA